LVTSAKKVVATDLYGNEGWTQTGGREADAVILEDSQAFSRRPITPGAVEFRIMDGTDLSFYPDESFDIAWSLSSIEHFGSHERAGDAVREMARVVRPGGVVVIATEYLLLADRSNGEYFNRTELEEHVIGASPHLALIEPVDWALPPSEYLIDSVVVVDAKAGRTRRHVVLNNGEDQWTSILVFFRRT
jgi:SAM-dependent methyltransferase